MGDQAFLACSRHSSFVPALSFGSGAFRRGKMPTGTPVFFAVLADGNPDGLGRAGNALCHRRRDRGNPEDVFSSPETERAQLFLSQILGH